LKIKLDENIPVDLIEILTSLGHDADTVAQEGLQAHSDKKILEAARKTDRFLITQDLDFSDIRQFAPDTHPGIPD